jgi:hypothetical protein
MELSTLTHFLERPDVLRYILGGYHGAYSLLVGKTPDKLKYVVKLKLAGPTTETPPNNVVVDGEEIPIVVTRDFQPLTPLRARERPLTP